MENEIEIFTDGSARNSKGGWGWIATFKERKLCSGKGQVNTKTTHQAMEILAVVKALETFAVCDLNIRIYSDSAYVVNCMNDKWYDEWNKNGWMTKAGTEVRNMKYWERLIACNRRYVKFQHVKAHQTSKNKLSFFNDFADKLASRRRKDGIRHKK